MSLTPQPEALRAQPVRVVLSLFPGVGLLDRGFELAGFCVVRGPDILWGGDVRKFHPPRGIFTGVIGGPPCQKFSGANYNRDVEAGMELVNEFLRVSGEAEPEFCLMENVPGVPTIGHDGYHFQRFNIAAAECGIPQNRIRPFQFGSRTGKPLVIHRSEKLPRSVMQPCCLASEGKSSMRRGWADFCALQGLPRDFDLPGFSRAEKYRAVGNGVPVPMAKLVADSIMHWLNSPWTDESLCACQCGRPVTGKQTLATAACRKRMSRRNCDASGRAIPGPVTASHLVKILSQQ